MNLLADKLLEYTMQHPVDFNSDNTSECADFIFHAYKETRNNNSDAVRELYASLDTYLDAMSIEKSNSLFQIIVSLADESEREGFLTGLKFGIGLMAEAGKPAEKGASHVHKHE